MYSILKIGSINTKKLKRFRKTKIKRVGKRIPKTPKSKKKHLNNQTLASQKSSRHTRPGGKNLYSKPESEPAKPLNRYSIRL